MSTLTDEEMARWVVWKRATETVLGSVVADITAATGLSGADFSVLTRVVEEGGGGLRQQRLSDDLGWERSRLSRQLVRMEQRGLVQRTGTTAARLVTATDEGRRRARHARRVHAVAVREHLLGAAPPGDAPFWDRLSALAGPAAP